MDNQARTQDEYKRLAAEKAVDFVESGMVVGLGHGSTAIHALRKLARCLSDGTLRDLVAVPCSKQVQRDAEALGIPLTTLDDHPHIDLTIDGADEADPDLCVIKGGGGALLREKIVAQATVREIIVVDASKLSDALGTNFAVPVEIIPFAYRPVLERLEGLCGQAVLRKKAGGAPFISDEGNWIIDCACGPIPDVYALSEQLNAIAGVVEHGLFLGLVSDLIVAGPGGTTHRAR